jgi:hypothetical protein
MPRNKLQCLGVVLLSLDYTKSPPHYKISVRSANGVALAGEGASFDAAFKDALDRQLEYADVLEQTEEPF